MNKKKRGIKYLLLRIAVCFVTGVFISIILIGGEGAFAWFTGIATGKASVSVMSTEDILDTFEVDRDKNPTKIVISRAGGLDFSPVLFFAVEGEISKYLLHIDPVRLEGRLEVDLPLVISLDQYRELQEDLDSESGQRISDEVKGAIRIKYLNEFIDEPLTVTFTKEYLMEEFEQGCERFRGGDARESTLGEEVKEYSLSETLQGIIELLAPGLQEYISGLIEKVSEFTQEIADLNERLSVLEAHNQALMLEIEELESRKGLVVDWGLVPGGLLPGGLDSGMDGGTGGLDGSLGGGLDGGSAGSGSGDGADGDIANDGTTGQGDDATGQGDGGSGDNSKPGDGDSTGTGGPADQESGDDGASSKQGDNQSQADGNTGEGSGDTGDDDINNGSGGEDGSDTDGSADDGDGDTDNITGGGGGGTGDKGTDASGHTGETGTGSDTPGTGGGDSTGSNTSDNGGGDSTASGTFDNGGEVTTE